jgi:uroporphyrinogen decarboxylase
MNDQKTNHPISLHQRVLDALHFLETNPLPYTLPIDSLVSDKLDLFFKSDSWREKIQDHIAVIRIPALGIRQDKHPIYIDAFGSQWRTDRLSYHLEQPPIPEPDLKGFHWPSIDDLWDEKSVNFQIESARQRGQFVVASTGFGLFERSWCLRGYENALTDMLLHPDFYNELLDRILELMLALVEKFSTLPVEGIMHSDDWGGQTGLIMGAKLWRRFIKPRVELFYTAVHNTGKWTFQHCCGDITEIIPELIECGLDVLESLQPEAMDIYEIKQKYGKELRLWGGLGTQQLLPHGNPDTIRAEIRKLRKELGRGGGYILAPAKPIMQDIPTENAAAVVEEFLAPASI